MINIFKAMRLEVNEDLYIADDVFYNLELSKSLNKELPIADLIKQVELMQSQVKRLKREGISIWNAKDKIPVIFDTVDGAFVAMLELIRKVEELEKKLEEKK